MRFFICVRTGTIYYVAKTNLKLTRSAIAQLLFSGSSIAILSFFPNLWLQSLAPVLLVPLMIYLIRAHKQHLVLAGILFFGSWLLPTTYWYYTFMSPLVGLLASFGTVLLLANLFLFLNIKNKKFAITAMITTWCIWTYIRIRIPYVEDWWIPHLGYSVWSNPAYLWVGKVGGETTIELAVLLLATLIAFTYTRSKKIAIMLGIGIYSVTVSFALVTSRANYVGPQVISIQSMTSGGVDVAASATDVDTLIATSKKALRMANPVFVIWPENSIPEDQRQKIVEFATNNKVGVIYQSFRQDNSIRHKSVFMLNANGGEILANTKYHIAPGEKGISKYSNQVVNYHGTSVTAYICYDMHYPDIIPRLKSADMAFVPMNDALFGYLQKQFHLADIALRAVQSNTTIVTSSTNGPTAIVLPNGSVYSKLPYDRNGVLISP